MLPHISRAAVQYANLLDQRNPSELYTNIFLDITVVRNSQAHILELTCCSEKNFSASGENKIQKYSNHRQSSKKDLTFHVHTIEVSSLGFE